LEASEKSGVFAILEIGFTVQQIKLWCDFLCERNLINGDKIIVSEIDLLQLLKEGCGMKLRRKMY